MQNGNTQYVTEPNFRKRFFPAENAGNLIFCPTMCISNAQNMTKISPIFEENFFPANNDGIIMPEIADFADLC